MAIGAEGYRQMLLGLLPPGKVWPRHVKATLAKLLLAFADELARIDGRGRDLLAEGDPRTTFELLGDWERILGLPDPCVTETGTISDRRDRVVAKLGTRGALNAQYYIDLAERLGYTVTIEELDGDFRCGLGRCGDRINDPAFRFVWRVRSTSTNVRLFRSGTSLCGERLRSFGNEALECLIDQRKPAHTNVIFAYGS